MADLKITPIEDVTVTRTRKPRKPGPQAELVETLLSLPTRAAKFVTPEIGEEFVKFQRAVRREANAHNLTAVFGDCFATEGVGTDVQVKLVEKRSGRPLVQNVVVEAIPEPNPLVEAAPAKPATKAAKAAK